jgi:NhaA family Na+:H+ antiporter
LADAATSAVTIGIVAGLVVGKTLGIAGAVVIAIRLGIARLPSQATITQVIGVSVVAGIGFTVSLFIAGLAFDDSSTIAQSKIGILAGSVAAAVIGAAILARSGRQPQPEQTITKGSANRNAATLIGGEN